MRPLEELVRPNIRTLKPYSTARDEFSGGEITTWLDANENPYDNGVNRYPDPHQKLLKQKIAALKGVREEQVFIGNGSDEAIDLCYRIFCRPGVDNAVSIAPTYGMYRVAAQTNDVELREVPLGADFSLPVEALLAAAAARADITGNASTLPLGRSLYGYWANGAVLNALLGDGALTALQGADWEEWSDFVETLSAWMAEPKAATVTLSGTDYTLPDARPGSLTATGVFAAPLDRVSGYTAALLAADGTYTADALTGPLNGVYSAVTLEWDHMAADGGEGIFRRAKLTDLLAEYGADTCNGLVLVPFKCQLDDSDLTAEDYNAEGLLNYPVLADVGSIAINAGTSADGLKAAKSAALWLYSNGAGEDALTETLGVVTPWNTAAGTTAVTAMQVQQVGTGILPGVALDTAAADALIANELTLQDSEKHTKAERTAFVDGALAALGAE